MWQRIKKIIMIKYPSIYVCVCLLRNVGIKSQKSTMFLFPPGEQSNDNSYISDFPFSFYLFWFFCILYNSQQNIMNFLWNEKIKKVREIIKESGKCFISIIVAVLENVFFKIKLETMNLNEIQAFFPIIISGERQWAVMCISINT